jgi:arsenate reductase
MKTLNVLFLCAHNSARSIMAEVILNDLANGRARGFSAGNIPRDVVNPTAIKVLNKSHLATTGLRSKSWDEFSQPDAPRMDVVITVCDTLTGNVTPEWSGNPVRAHWPVEDLDPMVEGKSEEETTEKFCNAFDKLERHIQSFMDLPLEQLDTAVLKEELDRIWRKESH